MCYDFTPFLLNLTGHIPPLSLSLSLSLFLSPSARIIVVVDLCKGHRQRQRQRQRQRHLFLRIKGGREERGGDGGKEDRFFIIAGGIARATVEPTSEVILSCKSDQNNWQCYFIKFKIEGVPKENHWQVILSMKQPKENHCACTYLPCRGPKL